MDTTYRYSLKEAVCVEKEHEFLLNVTLKSVTVSNPDYLPVYRWIYSENDKYWYIKVETELKRKQNDFLELSKLLREI